MVFWQFQLRLQLNTNDKAFLSVIKNAGNLGCNKQKAQKNGTADQVVPSFFQEVVIRLNKTLRRLSFRGSFCFCSRRN